MHFDRIQILFHVKRLKEIIGNNIRIVVLKVLSK